MKVLARARFLAAGAAALGAAAGRAGAQNLIKVNVITVPVDVAALPYYARDKGFFAKVGLDADVSVLGNGAQIIPALSSGKADFGAAGTTSVALAHERGLAIVMVAPSGLFSIKIRSHAMVVLPESPIRGPKDLVGKTIGEAGLRTAGDVAIHAWLEKSGVDVSTVKLIEVPFGSLGPMLKAGHVDAVAINEPYLSPLLAQGGRPIGIVYDAIGPQWVQGGFITTLDYVKAHPDIVKKFAEAMTLAADWANHNRAEAIALLNKDTGSAMPPDVQLVLYTDKLRSSEIQPVIDASAKYGLLKAAFPARDLFAPGFGD